jgi:integrase/recombinase XerD
MAKEKRMKISPAVHKFFDQYLPYIKGVSPNTVKSYRDTFRLLLPFIAKYYDNKINSLRVEHISSEVIIAFLNELQVERNNLAKTRNQRLAAIKSFAKMIRFMHPEYRELADRILNIPQKRTQKPLVGFFYQDEILKVFHCVDIKRGDGFRDYTLLHLLYDSGARASEITALNIDYFDPDHNTLAILGKGDRFRIIPLEKRTSQLIQLYIKKYRVEPKAQYKDRIFINQRREEFTRHGIYRLCKKYLSMAIPAKRLKYINPAHSFRHSRAVDLLYRGESITDIKNRLGHDNIQSTMIYLHLDLKHKRDIQKQFIRYMQSVIISDSKIQDLLQWESDKDMMAWLDSL